MAMDHGKDAFCALLVLSKVKVICILRATAVNNWLLRTTDDRVIAGGYRPREP